MTTQLTIFTSMLGQVMETITGKIGEEQMIFISKGGKQFKFFHQQDCCETVQIEDIVGDISDLIGEPILEAEETSMIGTAPPDNEFFANNCTWTFYRFSTIKGTITVRWLGMSNGYYSERVAFEETNLNG